MTKTLFTLRNPKDNKRIKRTWDGKAAMEMAREYGLIVEIETREIKRA